MEAVMSDKKYVVTIARQFGSLGRPIAKLMSKKLGVEYYDRDIVEQAAKKLNLPVSQIDELEEKVKKTSTNSYKRMMYPLGTQSSTEQDRIFEAQQNIMKFLVERESCIIVGRCSDFVLSDEENAVHIYIYAPYEQRVKNCVNDLHLSEEEAKKIGAVDFLAQGTIYPDVVESGLGGESGVIKSHHNVGGLPEHVDFKDIIEPLRDLFKDEVRKAGLELGIPERLVFRQPFPGPGLGIRIIGEVTEEKVKIVQDADAIYREEIANAGLDKNINQYFAALTNMRSVGVMGDERTYDYAVALRAVTTVDFMTAEAAEIPYDVLNKVMSRIINEVKGVNRVFYDLTSKPPGTIEFE